MSSDDYDDRFYIILVADIDEAQREYIHAAVKMFSDSWWHELPDVWIVQGGTAAEWRNRLDVLFLTGGSLLVVLNLPVKGQRYYGTRGADSRWAWIRDHYFKGKPEAEPDDEEPF